ncbi:unnamed protein product [Brassica rapa]|uniref:F-box domain-containing protein n=1 Tax=Brassica campestris TaxID=3711 RepID=A0A8D9DKG8_BRACM|nr:unnamed protein product [Brassica rapa]
MSCEDKISALHDDLLLKILSQVPTKDAVTTMILSKRWGLVWTMVPKLEYKDTWKEGDKSIWRLLEKSLQLHKAPVLEILNIQVECQFCDDADVGKSLVLDSPGLRRLTLIDPHGDLDSIQNMPHLDWAYVLHFVPNPKDKKFLRSFSSVKVLRLSLRNVECCSTIKFSRLIKVTLHLYCFDDFMCSLEPLLLFLHNSPILKVLEINYVSNFLHLPQNKIQF